MWCLLEQTLAIVHAATAQLFFALTVCLAVFTSAGWTHGAVETTLNDGGRLRRLGAVTTATCVWANRLRRGVAPYRANGSTPILLFAALVTLHVIFIIIRVMKDHSTQPGLTRPALMLFALTLAQIVLGTLSLLRRNSPPVAIACRRDCLADDDASRGRRADACRGCNY